MYLFLIGVGLLSVIIGLLWMLGKLQYQLLARIAYSGLVARLAVLGAAFTALGVLLILADLYNTHVK